MTSGGRSWKKRSTWKKFWWEDCSKVSRTQNISAHAILEGTAAKTIVNLFSNLSITKVFWTFSQIFQSLNGGKPAAPQYFGATQPLSRIFWRNAAPEQEIFENFPKSFSFLFSPPNKMPLWGRSPQIRGPARQVEPKYMKSNPIWAENDIWNLNKIKIWWGDCSKVSLNQSISY